MECARCGSVYSVTYTKVIFRDSDTAECQVCGDRLASWSSSRIPHYKLEKAADWPKQEPSPEQNSS